MKIEIPIICHSEFDLSKFDFSFKDLYLFEIRSTDFESYIQSLNNDNFEHNTNFVKQIKSEIHFNHQKYYAVVKKDFTKDFNQQIIFNVHSLLLIMFPSDLQILHIIGYSNSEGFFQSTSMESWNERTTGQYPGEYLSLPEEFLPETNEFIKFVFDRLTDTNYLGIAIYHYLSSYEASHYHYQYIALCMVIESMIMGPQELNYRLKRNAAVLVGISPFNCRKIFNNLNKVYSLRSKIVHGEAYEIKKIGSYLPYLRSMASRIIVEMLLHNFKNNDDLNQKITELGYGDKSKISDSYREYKINVRTYSDVNWTDLN